MNNILYFLYYLLKTDYKDLGASLHCAAARGYGRGFLILDMTRCALVYGSSFADYFNFRFYEKSRQQRATYATMGFMYQFHKRVNDPVKSGEIDDKTRFPLKFGKYCHKGHVFRKTDDRKLTSFVESRIGRKLVLKDPQSTAGKGVKIVTVSRKGACLTLDDQPLKVATQPLFRRRGMLYVEDYIEQHETMRRISPSAVNTVRIITLLDRHGNVQILGSVFRISVDCPIDNYSAGNLAAEIDARTGVVITGGIRKRASCDVYHDDHPVTGARIKGFQIPHWEEVIAMVQAAARIVPEVRSVGWDIAVTPDGPLLIEANSKWNKDTWQIAAGYGKKHLIDQFL